MLIAVVIATVGVALMGLGLKGFSREGMQFTQNTVLTGAAARVAGIVCLLMGSPLTIFGFWMMIRIADGPR